MIIRLQILYFSVRKAKSLNKFLTARRDFPWFCKKNKRQIFPYCNKLIVLNVPGDELLNKGVCALGKGGTVLANGTVNKTKMLK